MSYIGNTKIGKMFLGNTEIAKAYLGNDLVFQKGGSPTPPGLEFHKYLIFDGNSGIETDVQLPENCTMRVSLGNETVKAQQGVFGAFGASSSIRMFLTSGTNATRRQIGVYYDSSAGIDSDLLNWTTATYSFFMTPNGFGWGNYFNSFTKGNARPSAGVQFAYASGGQRYTGRMGTFMVYGVDAANCTDATDLLNNYTPIMNFRPCLYNGEAGLWYVEGGAFYGKTGGTGTLTVDD